MGEIVSGERRVSTENLLERASLKSKFIRKPLASRETPPPSPSNPLELTYSIVNNLIIGRGWGRLCYPKPRAGRRA